MNVYFEAFKIWLAVLGIVSIVIGLGLLFVLFPIFRTILLCIFILALLYFLIVASMQL